MKNYHLDKKARPQNKRNLFLVLGSLVVFALLFFSVFSFARNKSQGLAAGIWKVKSEVIDRAALNFEAVTKPKRILVSENETLRNELLFLKASLLQTQSIQMENTELKSILGRTGEGELLLTHVLSVPHNSLYRSIIVDVGVLDGVEANSVVVSDGVLAVGKIIDVFDKTSTIQPFSINGVETPMILEKGFLPVVAVGEGGNQVSFNVPRDQKVLEGDILLYPGGQNYISAIVERVDFDARDSEKKILARLPVNINELRWLEIFTD